MNLLRLQMAVLQWPCDWSNQSEAGFALPDGTLIFGTHRYSSAERCRDLNPGATLTVYPDTCPSVINFDIISEPQ